MYTFLFFMYLNINNNEFKNNFNYLIDFKEKKYNIEL